MHAFSTQVPSTITAAPNTIMPPVAAALPPRVTEIAIPGMSLMGALRVCVYVRV